VSQREAVLGEQPLRVRRDHAGLEDREPRHRVDRHELVEAHQVEHHDGGLVATQRRDPADHRRAAAERHEPDAVLDAHVDDPLDLVRVGRHHHRVRRAQLTDPPVPQQVHIGQSTGAADPVLPAGQHVPLADDRGQRHAGVVGQRRVLDGECGIRRRGRTDRVETGPRG
jgi:hypothetical protein